MDIVEIEGDLENDRDAPNYDPRALGMSGRGRRCP
jgi:hypothetical protein